MCKQIELDIPYEYVKNKINDEDKYVTIVDGIWPLVCVDFKNVKSLCLDCYEYDLKYVDFKNIIHLELAENYYLSLEGVNFKNIVSLDIKGGFDHSLKNVDFGKITTLYLGEDFEQDLKEIKDFKNIKFFYINCSFGRGNRLTKHFHDYLVENGYEKLDLIFIQRFNTGYT